MVTNALAERGSSPLPWVKRSALVALLAAAWVAVSVVSTPRQAHALAPLAVGLGRVVLGSLAPGAISGVVDGVADVDGLDGTPPGGGNGGGGPGGSGDFSSHEAKTKGRLGALIEMGATILGLGAFSMDWSLKDGQSNSYADPPVNACPGPPYCGVVTQGAPLTGVAQTLNANGSVTVTFSKTASPESIVYPTVYYHNASHQLVGSSSTSVGGSHNAGTFSITFGSRPEGAHAGRIILEMISPLRVVYDWLDTAPQTPASPGGEPGTTPITTTTTTTCSGGGSSQQVITYTANDAVMPKITGQCPAGQTITGVTQTSTAAGQSVANPLGSGVTAPVVPSGYPECNPLGSCVLVLTRTLVDGSTQLCNGSGACAEWMLQARTGPSVQVRTATGTLVQERARAFPDGSYMTCRYGPYTIPSDECSVVPTEPIPTADPPTDEDNCDFRLSRPHTWPLTALKCAFIPRQSVVEEVTSDLDAAWQDTPPGVVAGGLQDVMGPFTDLRNVEAVPCEGPLIEFTLPTGQEVAYHPLNACSSLAQLVLGYVMPFLSASVYLAAFSLGARTLGRTIGFDPPQQAV